MIDGIRLDANSVISINWRLLIGSKWCLNLKKARKICRLTSTRECVRVFAWLKLFVSSFFFFAFCFLLFWVSLAAITAITYTYKLKFKMLFNFLCQNNKCLHIRRRNLRLRMHSKYLMIFNQSFRMCFFFSCSLMFYFTDCDYLFPSFYLRWSEFIFIFLFWFCFFNSNWIYFWDWYFWSVSIITA